MDLNLISIFERDKRKRHRRAEGCMMTEAKIGVMQPPAKELGATRSGETEGFSLVPTEGEWHC